MDTIKFITRFPKNRKITKTVLGMWKNGTTDIPDSDLRTYTLKEILEFKKRGHYPLCAIQRFNTPYRVGKDSEEYDFRFNKCIFIDIDYCKCKIKPVSPKELRSTLLETLKQTPGFLYMENSMHMDENKELTNFHIIFYHPQSNVHYYGYFHEKYNKIIKGILSNLNINCSECLDENVSNPCHLMFLTGNEYYLNSDLEEPDFDFKDFENWYKANVKAKQEQPKIDYTGKYHLCGGKSPNEHLGYTQRWYLFSNLCKVLTGDDLKSAWVNICNQMNPGKHSTQYYIDEPYKHDWITSSERVETLNEYLIFKYGVFPNDINKSKKLFRKWLKRRP